MLAAVNQKISVDEAKKLKQDLEKQIAKLLFDFSAQSGMIVQDIDFRCVEVIDGKPAMYFVEIEAKL